MFKKKNKKQKKHLTPNSKTRALSPYFGVPLFTTQSPTHIAMHPQRHSCVTVLLVTQRSSAVGCWLSGARPVGGAHWKCTLKTEVALCHRFPLTLSWRSGAPCEEKLANNNSTGNERWRGLWWCGWSKSCLVFLLKKWKWLTKFLLITTAWLEVLTKIYSKLYDMYNTGWSKISMRFFTLKLNSVMLMCV